MARQSFRKRQIRYEIRRQEEFDRFQRLLRRQQIRLDRDYRGRLSAKQVQLINDILASALILVINGFRVKVTDSCALDRARRGYFKICAILRKAGSISTPSRKPPKVVLRKH
jgi:hypothetical protein